MADTEKVEQLLNRLKDKDQGDYDHSLRVQHIVEKILTGFSDMPDNEKSYILIAAVLHDIGNLEISDHILKKSSRLDFDEYEEMQHHVEHAEKLIKDFDCFNSIKGMIRHHHENINGFGYPDGLEGDKIPLGARIIHVAEAFDSMTNVRKNRKNVFTKDRAFLELKEYAGRIYDKNVVEKFSAIYPEL